MSSVHVSSESATGSPPAKAGEVSLEVVVVPVSDVDRAKEYYASDLAEALERAADAHGSDEERIGEKDPDWPDWPDRYAIYMVGERTGAELPT